MMIMGLGGIALIAVGFTVLIMNRFQQTESVYFSEYGKRVKGRIVSTQKEAEEAHFGAEHVKSYEIKVAYAPEGNEDVSSKNGRSEKGTDDESDTGDKWVSQNGISQNALARMKELGIDIDENEDDDKADSNVIEAIGIFNGEQLADIEHTPGAEIEFFYDTNNPARVIFYDPAAKAAKTSARNKIALVVMLAGVAVFLVGRIMI